MCVSVCVSLAAADTVCLVVVGVEVVVAVAGSSRVGGVVSVVHGVYFTVPAGGAGLWEAAYSRRGRRATANGSLS